MKKPSEFRYRYLHVETWAVYKARCLGFTAMLEPLYRPSAPSRFFPGWFDAEAFPWALRLDTKCIYGPGCPCGGRPARENAPGTEKQLPMFSSTTMSNARVLLKSSLALAHLLGDGIDPYLGIKFYYAGESPFWEMWNNGE